MNEKKRNDKHVNNRNSRFKSLSGYWMFAIKKKRKKNHEMNHNNKKNRQLC